MGWRKEDQRGGHPIAAEEQGARGMGQCTLPMRQPCTRTFGGQGLGKMKGSGDRGGGEGQDWVQNPQRAALQRCPGLHAPSGGVDPWALCAAQGLNPASATLLMAMFNARQPGLQTWGEVVRALPSRSEGPRLHSNSALDSALPIGHKPPTDPGKQTPRTRAQEIEPRTRSWFF